MLMDDRVRSLVAVENMRAAVVLKDLPNALDPVFDKLFRDHYALVYRTAYSVTASVEDAEDVVQTIFLRLLRREFPPDLKRNPKAYFYRAAFNVSLTVLRSRRRKFTDRVEDLEAPQAARDAGLNEDSIGNCMKPSRNSIPERRRSSSCVSPQL